MKSEDLRIQLAYMLLTVLTTYLDDHAAFFKATPEGRFLFDTLKTAALKARQAREA